MLALSGDPVPSRRQYAEPRSSPSCAAWTSHAAIQALADEAAPCRGSASLIDALKDPSWYEREAWRFDRR